MFALQISVFFPRIRVCPKLLQLKKQNFLRSKFTLDLMNVSSSLRLLYFDLLKT